MKKETKVKCDVKSCKYNDEKYCELDELDISCTCDNDCCEDMEETICKSFEKDESDEYDDAEELEYDEIDSEEELENEEEFEDDSDFDNYYEDEIEDDIELEEAEEI